MDESLFRKHLVKIKQHKNNKEEVLMMIKESVGIELDESMITISKKEITFSVSSTIKQLLYQKNVIPILKEKGYSIKN